MNLVLDASAVYVILSGAGADDVLRAAEDVSAPDLLVPELLNARWKMLRAGRDAPTLELILAFLERIRLLPSVEYAAEADALARALDHAVYDCLYAAVAGRADATLVTADAQFAGKLANVKTRIVRAG